MYQDMNTTAPDTGWTPAPGGAWYAAVTVTIDGGAYADGVHPLAGWRHGAPVVVIGGQLVAVDTSDGTSHVEVACLPGSSGDLRTDPRLQALRIRALNAVRDRLDRAAAAR